MGIILASKAVFFAGFVTQINGQTVLEMVQDFQKGTPRFKDATVERSMWEQVVDVAAEYNEPGKFTAFNGYEWSSTTDGNNLHRVVIYRDGPDRVKQLLH